MRVTIHWDINHLQHGAEIAVQQFLEHWAHAQCDSEHEVEDVNTGDVLGTLTLSSEDMRVEVQP